MLQILRTLPHDYICEQSVRLVQLLRPLLQDSHTMRIFLYAPLPHEVDLRALLHLYPQHSFYFPRCLTGHLLSFHLVTDLSKHLLPVSLGILAPLASLPVLTPQLADLIIVPGLAFTTSGSRLGYGGGYYDRLLATCPAVPSLSLALPEQLLPSLPSEAHDVPVSRVLYIS